jgi:hypothetical protein
VRGAFGLTSASIFREEDRVFRRMAADRAWDNAARTLDPNDPMLERARGHRPYDVDDEAAARNDLPDGLMRPILAVPVGDRLRCLGLALYGPHATGNALSHDERSMLAELADKAASALMKLSDEQLRHRIAVFGERTRNYRGRACYYKPALLSPPYGPSDEPMKMSAFPPDVRFTR